MFDANVAAILIVGLLGLVALGVHIAIALGMTSALGIWFVTRDMEVVATMLGSTAYESLRDYVFAVIPLFMLMGEFIGRSGAVGDVYRGINRLLRRLPGRLAIATVLGNALFSFVTGVSIASAAARRPRSTRVLLAPSFASCSAQGRRSTRWQHSIVTRTVSLPGTKAR